MGSGREVTDKKENSRGKVQVQLKRNESDGKTAYVVTLYINQSLSV